jgi:hypothetical protein
LDFQFVRLKDISISFSIAATLDPQFFTYINLYLDTTLIPFVVFYYNVELLDIKESQREIVDLLQTYHAVSSIVEWRNI